MVLAVCVVFGSALSMSPLSINELLCCAIIIDVIIPCRYVATVFVYLAVQVDAV